MQIIFNCNLSLKDIFTSPFALVDPGPGPGIHLYPALAGEQLCSPAAGCEARPGPPAYSQIVQSKLLHRRVKLNVGGVRWLHIPT